MVLKQVGFFLKEGNETSAAVLNVATDWLVSGDKHELFYIKTMPL